MMNLLKHSSRYLPAPLRKLARRVVDRLEPRVFQTEAGVKYRLPGFDSDRFKDYLVREVPFTETGASFSELLLPPDLLRNRYTTSGQSILCSPHNHLFKQIIANALTEENDYLLRTRKGTLDARLPFSPSLPYMMQRFNLQREALFSKKSIVVHVVKSLWQNKPVYVIFDGKHRAALAAAFERPESLLLRVIANDVIMDPFFRRVYAYTLRRDPVEYSINQEMIRALQNEPQIT
jgi:hypothetical protein